MTKVKKSDRYNLTVDVSALTDNELRGLKLNLNYRWIAHMQKGHMDAAASCKAVSDMIRAELALRAQERHLNEV